MLHRAILGSVERFIGTLIEHYSGAFPLWLAPVQVLLIPIKPEHILYANSVKDNLQNNGLRVIMDASNESLNKRIREGALKKLPYIVIMGDKEVGLQKLSVRKRSEGDVGIMGLADFVSLLKTETDFKK